MVFDPNEKNVSPMYICTVHNGAITYRLARMAEEPAARKPQAAAQIPPAQDPAAAQAASTVPWTPYARVGEGGMNYVGPRDADLPPGPVHVILFGPEAPALARSPGMTAELRAVSAQGRQWIVLPVESAQNWGEAATQLVHALVDEHPLAIVALGRDASHLSEQLALKTFVPVVALSDDKTLTSANIPWIFRLPSGTSPVAALRLLEQAEARSAANPERVRDVLASGKAVSGIAFRPTGEPRAQ
jgi:hypothetical protein